MMGLLFAMAVAVAHPTPAPAPTIVGESVLDIVHSYVSADLLGCAVSPNDEVNLDGLPTRVMWDQALIVPASPVPLSAADLHTMKLFGMTDRPRLAHLRIRISPGYYQLAVRIGSCRFLPAPLVVSDDYGGRHVTLVTAGRGSSALPLEPIPAALYGTIPLLDARVTLTQVDGNATWFAVNEQQTMMAFDPRYAYYFDAVPPGRYELRVSGFGWTRDLGPIDIGPSGKASYRRITAAELDLPQVP